MKNAQISLVIFFDDHFKFNISEARLCSKGCKLNTLLFIKS